MRRLSKSPSFKLSADSQRLLQFAQAAAQASSRLEERAWERRLDALLHRLLKNNHQSVVDAVLDHAFKLQSPAYDILMDSVEAVSESCLIEHEGAMYDGLLIAAPILAWTRFSIGSGPMTQDMATTLSAHLNAHLLAPGARLAMMPQLYSIDQLPRTHSETFAFMHRLADAALKGTAPRPPSQTAETAPFLADTRYLLAAVVVKSGEPIFGWQENPAPTAREQAFSQWKTQAVPSVSRLLPGCGVDLLMPEGYYAACREADKQIRPASIRAAVHYLTHALGVEAGMLHATIGGFGADPADGRVDEYRIGFLLHQNPDVVYGVVWPLYGTEEEDVSPPQPDNAIVGLPLNPAELAGTSPLEDILALLRACGVTRIKRHEGCYPMESCEDCGASLFLDPDGELTHAEMPEDLQQQGSTHFH